MKKYSIFALMSAIALTGAVGFTGCSSSDDVVKNEKGQVINPTYDPIAKTVKTDFTLSFNSGASSSKTRMAAADIQADGTTFNGIKDIQLLPFALEDASAGVGDENIPTASSIIAADKILNTSGEHKNTTATNSHFYHFVDVEVPTGTTNFLFYGLQNKAATDAATKFQYGYLTPPASFAVAANTYTFTPDAIYDGTANATCTAIITWLTKIAAADVSFDGGSTSKKWAAVDGTEDPYAPQLKVLYDSFTSLKAGSSASVRKAVTDLFISLCANSLTTIGADIITQINTQAVTDVSAQTISFTKEGSLLVSSAVNDYPGNINLPDGAAVIKWTTGDGGVKTPSVPISAEEYTGMAATVPTKFAYPPSLYYYANTPIVTSNSIQDKEYTSQSTWTGVTINYTTGTSVDESTVDIALVDEIRYAVGQMILQIKASGTDGTGAYSGQKVLIDKLGNEVPLVVSGSTNSSFPITGIIIGGQKGVNYKFEPSGSTEYTIYDKQVSGSVKNTDAGSHDTNYTLALETAATTPVSMVIELQNNSGVDFRGIEGVVFNGSKFYLAATLTPNPALDGVNDSSAGAVGNRVFKQHYVTTVNLTIKTNNTNSGSAEAPNYPDGLGAAYNTIPDLGSPALRLGFSVNLSWDAGLTFEQNI